MTASPLSSITASSNRLYLLEFQWTRCSWRHSKRRHHEFVCVLLKLQYNLSIHFPHDRLLCFLALLKCAEIKRCCYAMSRNTHTNFLLHKCAWRWWNNMKIDGGRVKPAAERQTHPSCFSLALVTQPGKQLHASHIISNIMQHVSSKSSSTFEEQTFPAGPEVT